jgi:hypothetical protein
MSTHGSHLACRQLEALLFLPFLPSGVVAERNNRFPPNRRISLHPLQSIMLISLHYPPPRLSLSLPVPPSRQGLGPSLPVAMMPEEVQYSLERNWIKLIKGYMEPKYDTHPYSRHMHCYHNPLTRTALLRIVGDIAWYHESPANPSPLHLNQHLGAMPRPSCQIKPQATCRLRTS